MAISINSNLPPLPTNLVSAATNDIRGIKAPVEIPSGGRWLWWVLGALAIATIVWLAWWYWRKRKTAAPAVVSLVPPHERAREKLREALALIHQPRPFCIAVSDTIRVYLEERFTLKAPERTTEEFLDELQASALLALEQKQTLGDFLSRCDLVKFARYEPGESELKALYDAAVRLVEETQPSPPLPSASDPASMPASQGSDRVS